MEITMKYRPNPATNAAARNRSQMPRTDNARFVFVCRTAVALLAGPSSAEGDFGYTRTINH